MADPYLAIAAIANDEFMTERMNACVTQQNHLGNVTVTVPGINGMPACERWVVENRYLWASSPSWGEKWASALVTNEADPDYEPGKDEAVITDADILATVQALAE